MNYLNPEYHKQKSKEHYQKYKDKYNERNTNQRTRTKNLLDEARSVGCKCCEETTIACLDFHHLDKNKKDLNVSKMRGYNDKKVLAEIAKCVVLCSNCHRKVHAGLIILDL